MMNHLARGVGGRERPVGRRGPAIALVSSLLWASVSFAEPPGRIGFFTLERVLIRTGLQEWAHKEFTTRLEERKRELDAIQGDLDQRSERFKLEGASLSPERRKEEEAAIEQKFAQLNRDKERHQQELLILDRSGRVLASRTVAEAVKEVGDEGGYVAILDAKRAGLYFLRQELDLTDAIIRRVKQRMEAGQASKTPRGETPAPTGEPARPSAE